jgi:cytochrome c oxidase cbb3-type subunit 3
MSNASKPLILAVATALTGCDQSQQDTQTKSQLAAQSGSATAAGGGDNLTISLVNIAPGGARPLSIEPEEAKRFDGVPEQIAAGRQLYQAYNCVGCHFNGGGGMGPPLMDDHWIYGSSMENIAASIIQGRPAGMPTFRKMVTGDQVWQLAAYVRSLSGLPEKEQAPADSERGNDSAP